jgi:transposase
MAVRLVVTDSAWAEIEPRLGAVKHKAGSPPELSDRLFIEAVLYVARTGIPWRDMPREFGRWDAVYNRFRRWEARGLWRLLWERLQRDGCHVAQHLFIDSTIVRAHQHAAGARQQTAGTCARLWAALGGGFSTNIHAGCLDEKTSVSLELTSGARHDAPVFEAVFEQCPEMPHLAYAVMDNGYDRDSMRQHLQDREVTPVIPPKRNRKASIPYDSDQYQLREKVERFFNKMKHFRRMATRYEKLRQTFLAFIHMVA